MVGINHKYNNINNSVSIGGGIGWMLGAIAGFYVGYQLFILTKIVDDTNFINRSNNTARIAYVLSFGLMIVGGELGSFLGDILYTI